MITTKRKMISDNQIRIDGIQALKEKLGVVGTVRFMEQFDNNGSGDYTKDKYETDDVVPPANEEVLNMFRS